MAHTYAGVRAEAMAGYHNLTGESATAISLIIGDDSAADADLRSSYLDAWSVTGLNAQGVVCQRSERALAGTELWQAWRRTGDVYLGWYDGWHCATCQRFYAHHEVQDGPSCPVHMVSVAKVQSDCWFFRLSGHLPLAADPVDVPLLTADTSEGQSTDAADTMVCMPLLALTSGWAASDADTVYLVPDHTVELCDVAWPAMLAAAGQPSPIGFVAVDSPLDRDTPAAQGDWRRLSPRTVAGDLGADALRYLVLRRSNAVGDAEFVPEAILDRHTAELALGLGNLVARTTAIAVNSDLGGKVPRPESVESPFADEIRVCRPGVPPDPEQTLDGVTSLVQAGNGFVDERRPWDQTSSDRAVTLWHILELCRVIGHLIAPVLPEQSRRLLGQLGVVERPHWPTWGSHLPAFAVSISSDPLFSLITGPSRRRFLPAWTKELQGGPPRVLIVTEDFSKFDLRVARVVGAELIATDGGHVLKLTLDLGASSRTVFSTKLMRSFAPESLVGRMVTYLSNLEPVEIAGFVSQGMVLAAVDGHTASLLTFDRNHEPGMVMF